MNVNIYIETALKGPVKRRMAGAWLVEYISRKGVPVTRGGMLYTDSATETEMCLMLIKQALSILTKTCVIRIFTHCPGILGAMNNHWLWKWQENGWKNSRGETLKNDYLWQQCAALIETHMSEWTEEEHSYKQCMLERAVKEMGQEHETKEPGNYLIIEVPEWNTRYRDDTQRDRRKV